MTGPDDRKTLSLKTFVKLMRAAGSVSDNVHQHLRQYHLTPSQFGVLEALYHLGPLRPYDIAKKVLKSPGNMVTVLDNLEKRGLVRRTPHPDDRRFLTIRLTEEGRDLISKIFPTHADVIAERMSVLSEEELILLGDLCRKLGKG
jgi:MarR family 2-MHQ and catechol resistance regulon transcriptional repressor